MSTTKNAPQLVDAQARQDALDTSRSICVTAPAGSGKTELLTQRILKLLATVNEPEAILAITFTRKAAAEMRERVVSALQLGQQSTEPEEAHKRLTWQLAQAALAQNERKQWHLLANPARLRLQTIDSLCQSIASDLPVLSQLGARLSPVDDPLPLYRQAVDAFFAELEAANSDSAIANAISQVLLHLDNNTARFYQLLIDMLPLRDQWLGYAAGYKGSDDTRQALEHTLVRWIEQELQNLAIELQSVASDLCVSADFAAQTLASLPAENEKSLIGELTGIGELPEPSYKNYRKWLAIVELLCVKEGSLRKQVDKRQGFPAKSATKDKSLAAEYEQRKKTFNQLLEQMRELPGLQSALRIVSSLPLGGYQLQHWAILEPLTLCLVRVVGHLRVVFGQAAQCDFNEITAAAFNALSADSSSSDSNIDSAIAYKWNQNIRHILVDEFQDTSVAQFRLIALLTEQWQQENSSGDDLPKTLFVVGDGMQSIYGFRAAKVGLFLGAREHGIGDLPLHAVELVQNFRSSAAIVEWNNQHFSAAFPQQADISRGAVPYSHAQSIQAADESTAAAVSALICCGEDGQQTEAEQVVAAITAQQQQNQANSIAILVRFRTHLRAIIPALDEAGIAWQGVDIDPLQNREVIMDCLSLTRALCNPADHIAWLAMLRAPWCGLSLTDLQCLVDAGRTNNVDSALAQPSLASTVQYLLEPQLTPQNHLEQPHKSADTDLLSTLSEAGQQRLQRFGLIMARHWQSRGRAPLRQWLESAWRQLHGPLLARHSFDGDDTASAHGFFDLLETIEQDCVASGKLFSVTLLEQRLQKLYAQSDNGGFNTEADNSESMPPVQIMTIHKSKGLEFDSVIIPGLNSAGRGDTRPLLSWNEHVFEDGSAGLVLCPYEAVGSPSLLDVNQNQPFATLADSQQGNSGLGKNKPGSKVKSSDLYEFLRDENKRVAQFELTRLFYVATTRARSRLLLLAQLDKNDDDSIKSPTSNTLLAALWPGLSEEVHMIDNAATQLTESEADTAIYPIFKRLTSACLDAGDKALQTICEQAVAQQIDTEKDLTQTLSGVSSTLALAVDDIDATPTSTASLLGTCVHEILEQLGVFGLEKWCARDIDTRQASWRARLLQLGVPVVELDSALTTVTQAMNNVIHGAHGQWLFDTTHQAAYNEWPLSRFIAVADTASGNPAEQPAAVSRYQIDRSFIDSDGCRWIIDYKIVAPKDDISVKNFINQQTQQYQSQMLNYKSLVTSIDQAEQRDSQVAQVEQLVSSEIKCALYFPLLDHLEVLDD